MVSSLSQEASLVTFRELAVSSFDANAKLTRDLEL